VASFEIIAIVLLFILYTLILYRPIKEGFSLQHGMAFTASLCIAGLAVIGLRHTSDRLFRMILIPHVAMAIALILIWICLFIKKLKLLIRERFNNHTYKYERIESDKLRK